MDDRKERIMDDQTEVPQCETTTVDGKIRCELDAGHEGGHARKPVTPGRCGATLADGRFPCQLDTGHEGFHDPEREFCGERDEDGAGCLNQDGHDGPHRTRGHMWGPSEPDVSWPPAEWRAPASVTVPQDLTARLDALERTVEHQRDRISHLAARLDALDGAAATAAEALRQHISEQASLTRRHVSVVLGTHVTRIEELIREKDIVPEDPFEDTGAPQDPAAGPCTATAQSPTGLVTCTQDEGHTGSHTNALAVWSDAPPVPPGGVYEVY